jgi:hypothetical protein
MMVDRELLDAAGEMGPEVFEAAIRREVTRHCPARPPS